MERYQTYLAHLPAFQECLFLHWTKPELSTGDPQQARARMDK